ncbi:Retrovirus-related Pol polyprotein from transposon RE1 [Vitis vinifera]|uniref:Retrovirus-related Pol polyprotein from transposon RE1 n=1 Tax=Vitis vinifera TaxID=29760 RepID=A0A438IHG1_VITVI|nr:Retrovirus-related Pol polyprotein from transposon RE1 [Vitis vinifera]
MFTTAYVVYLDGNVILWSSYKQKSITHSSTEAEYHVVATTTVELSWVQSLLGELRVSLPKLLVIHCDNVDATYLCANLVFHSCMKHISIDFHFLRDKVDQGSLIVFYISSGDQFADTVTKLLSYTRFEQLHSKIGVSDGGSIL